MSMFCVNLTCISGPVARQIGRILRIRKFSTKSKVPRHDNLQNDTTKDTHHPILSDDEQKLWSEWPAMAEATTPAAMAHIYACEIIQPLLGRDHVDAGVPSFAIFLSHLVMLHNEKVMVEVDLSTL